jgi:hypothetical protein
MSGYNGWTNYETWLVNLWHGESLATITDLTPEQAQEYVEETLEMACDSGFEGDLLRGALSAVSWKEIAATSNQPVAWLRGRD